jgi:hypothetical protein
VNGFTCRPLGELRRIIRNESRTITMSRIRSRLGRVVVGFAAAAAAVVGVITVAAPQSASAYGTPGCVSQSEFGQVRNGMTRARVARVFGTDGRTAASSRYGGYRAMVRSYKGCRQYSYISVGFSADPGEPLRVNAKSGVFS